MKKLMIIILGLAVAAAGLAQHRISGRQGAHLKLLEAGHTPIALHVKPIIELP